MAEANSQPKRRGYTDIYQFLCWNKGISKISSDIRMSRLFYAHSVRKGLTKSRLTIRGDIRSWRLQLADQETLTPSSHDLIPVFDGFMNDHRGALLVMPQHLALR